MKTTNQVSAMVLLLVVSVFLVGCAKSEKLATQETATMTTQVDSSVVREYSVDVATLDVNGDGTVYQCPMHWNVISDKSGTCPLCNMNLKEYSVADAQQNLEHHKSHKH